MSKKQEVRYPACSNRVYRGNWPQTCSRNGLHSGQFTFTSRAGETKTLAVSLCREHRDRCLKAEGSLDIRNSAIEPDYPYEAKGIWIADPEVPEPTYREKLESKRKEPTQCPLEISPDSQAKPTSAAAGKC